MLVALGPEDALALLDAVESAGGEDMPAAAATMVAAVLEKAKSTLTATGAYVSGALGKLAYCGNVVKAAAAPKAAAAAEAGHLEVVAAERTDMTRFPVTGHKRLGRSPSRSEGCLEGFHCAGRSGRGSSMQAARVQGTGGALLV